jgi:hypothetical protein
MMGPSQLVAGAIGLNSLALGIIVKFSATLGGAAAVDGGG